MDKPSKYDEVARELSRTLKADAVLLVVVNGAFGSGGCRCIPMNTRRPLSEVQAGCVATLRALADSIERENGGPARVDWTQDPS